MWFRKLNQDRLKYYDLKRNFNSYKEQEVRVLLGLDDFSGRDGGPRPLIEEQITILQAYLNYLNAFASNYSEELSKMNAEARAKAELQEGKDKTEQLQRECDKIRKEYEEASQRPKEKVGAAYV